VFPTHFGDWLVWQEASLDKDTLDVLKADDTMQRLYVDPATHRAVWLFIAFFKTQRTGQSPHSPKNCLPGSGWEPIKDDRPLVQVPGEAAPIKINRYITQKGTDTDVVLYWYQSHGRVVANEFAAKFWSVADAMRYNRSDTSLIRVSVAVANGDVEGASRTGMEFTKAVFPSLLSQLPR
jgi:EpsI family protein